MQNWNYKKNLQKLKNLKNIYPDYQQITPFPPTAFTLKPIEKKLTDFKLKADQYNKQKIIKNKNKKIFPSYQQITSFSPQHLSQLILLRKKSNSKKLTVFKLKNYFKKVIKSTN